MPELKCCPFCGGHVQFTRSDPADGVYAIFCNSCKALTRWNIEMAPHENYGENAEKWAAKWNARAGDPDA